MILGSLTFEENGITIEFDDSIFGDGAFPIVLTVLFLVLFFIKNILIIVQKIIISLYVMR